MAAAQHVLEQRVAGVFEQEAVAEPGDGAIELGGKARLGENQLQLRHGDQGLANGAGVGAQAVGHFEQNAVNLARPLPRPAAPSSLLRSMVSSGSTNRVCPLALARESRPPACAAGRR